ncbi:tryptophan halogenase family protein [Roseateles saccharophilus]|uniref:Tryptophan halogenase n=1 Tax=Roseateles saccharophilus TaxID=304 RepID=A0A4R3VJK4_ROSSA|nr:tryptophan halogenase family protein [Roseateles saccharophilus]MDG0835454.1 tryptophan 7-halogenase [Roseateles saccharophilus]TCV04018.1 tryptophan halogenase [Roseateles saccharophilus]
MAQKYERIVVVGGGSAGWMTATALATEFKGRIGIELVESEDIGIIGVGEATFPSIREYNRLVGIDEAEFLRATNGTYKLGIRFHDWLELGRDYFHTFGHFGNLFGSQTLWAQHRRMGLAEPLGQQCVPTVMAMQGRFVLPSEQAQFKYAYHFDAVQYAAFLRQLAIQRGVRHTQGRIVEVARRADGGVAALQLDDGRRVEGDLFIDCSGFRSLLLGDALQEPFVDFSHWLPVDGAWACPCERSGEEIKPYTEATALEGGWAWRIPLQNRTGHGHVFSSRFIDVDRAREQLLARLDGKPLAEPRLLRFTTGHRQRFWVHNVVSIGLSSGFLEPLESTSIYLIQDGIARLMAALTTGRPLDENDLALFNDGAARRFARIRDFIILHYCLTRRRDSELWRHVATMELPETLAFRLALWRGYGVLHEYDEEGFDATSWLAIHAGMDHWPERQDPVIAEIPAERALQALKGRSKAIAASVERMPLHRSTLRQVLGQ